MTKIRETSRKPASLFLYARKTGLYDVEPYDRSAPRSEVQVRDEIRLKGFLKRAVEKDFASESLINAIKLSIRR